MRLAAVGHVSTLQTAENRSKRQRKHCLFWRTSTKPSHLWRAIFGQPFVVSHLCPRLARCRRCNRSRSQKNHGGFGCFLDALNFVVIMGRIWQVVVRSRGGCVGLYSCFAPN